MATLINGNGNPAVYANQDADLIASICGDTTCIAAVGSEFAATQEDANTIGLADGVIVTKEGRRIQLDAGYTDLFTIPTGTAGTTSYYIIGYKLSTDSDSKQICETFVQKMNSATDVIQEDTFRGGATDVYVSVYRVTQDGLNIDTIEALLPKLSNVNELKSALGNIGDEDYELGTPVNITDTVTHTATTDGIIYVEAPANGFQVAYVPTELHALGNSSYTGAISCYIRKGLSYKKGSGSSGGVVRFYPVTKVTN